MHKSRIGGLMTAVALAVTGGAFAAPTAAQADEATPAYFAFTDYTGREFVFKLTDHQRIAEARMILSGEEQSSTHVMGRFRKMPVVYNPAWSYHLDPNTINFFTVAIEVCDSSIEYLEDHLDEAGGAFLPGMIWCPWASRLTREIDAG